MAIRRTLAQFSDEIVAADIAANAVGASELADNAVDTAAIADDAITNAKIGAAAVGATEIAADAVGESQLSVDFTTVKPHIITNVLYPAVANIMLDGTTALSAVTTGPNSSTVTSSKYGTVQSDGRMYYYTDIKGSKPIKDPRIGAHFGGQRHKFKSVQILEQETAMHGLNVFSVDGREWLKVQTTNSTPIEYSDHTTGRINLVTDNVCFFEIVGYFNDANLLLYSGTASSFFVYLNGGTAESNTGATVTTGGALGGRYVDNSALINLVFDTTPTLGINTIKILKIPSHNVYATGIELIAQDTTSTATRSQIQIPSQNVVSYGKKFTVSGTPHYNPFATKGDGSASTIPNNTTGDSVATGWAGSTSAYWESTLDTATSLGLTAWEEGGAFYRPVNGGRVVKWVDSTGTIKTSVNMMPPSAKAAGSHSGDATPTGVTNWSTQYLPIFSSGTIDHSQAEVAKTFYASEFGNGGGNFNASYKDATSAAPSAANNIAYVMDDGLTSLTGYQVQNYNTYLAQATANTYTHTTFIGTGISQIDSSGVVVTLSQNLPYGTHIVKRHTSGGGGTVKVDVDGVEVVGTGTVSQSFREFTFHQPKMPPIPEDAVIISDYMLMADFVAQTANSGTNVSKGVRLLSSSRDIVSTMSSLHTAMQISNNALPFHYQFGGNGAHFQRAPFFGTRVGGNKESNGTATTAGFVKIDTANVSYTAVDASVSNNWILDINDLVIQSTASTLGLHTGEVAVVSTGKATRMDFATPIHTSSHYQTFETPYLKELVGGDRNMEQTNLVVTADGKTWDEVTRKTDYLGTSCIVAHTDTDHAWGSFVILDEWRGNRTTGAAQDGYLNKDFALGYDRVICLVDGFYHISASARVISPADLMIYVDGQVIQAIYYTGGGYSNNQQSAQIGLKRGEYVQIRGEFGLTDGAADFFQITRIK